MTAATDLSNAIRLALSADGHCVYRANVGKFKMADGRWFDTGLPKGFSDLFGNRAGDAVAFFVLGDQQVATPPLRLGGQAALVPGKDHPHQRNQRAGGDATDDENPGDERGGSVQ